MKNHLWITVSFIIICIFTLGSCSSVKYHEETKENTELTNIIKSGKLRVLVDCNSTNYFLYRGKTMGYQYAILQHLAKDMRLKLEIKVSNNQKESFEGLKNGDYDLIAKNLIITKDREKEFNFTGPILQTRQILVQRKPKGWKSLSLKQINDSLIRNQLDLAGKTIYIQKNSAYKSRLEHLSDEIGTIINIVQDSIYGVEQLIAKVSKGEIDYTICEENVANINKQYYSNLDISTPVSFPQNLAWAVRKEEPEWLNYLDNWIKNFKETKEYKAIYKKYYISKRSSFVNNKTYHSNLGGEISPYDKLIKEYSKQANIDWRLVAAIIYQESRFNPDAVSWQGAYGLMQVIPESADRFNIEDIESPEGNIKAGVKLLEWLNSIFEPQIPDATERLKFILASYNAGYGHVKDAQRLAVKYHKNPHIWTGNVDYFMLNKSNKKYYTDKVVKWGYCRGSEPFNYVNGVIDNYEHYCNLIKPEILIAKDQSKRIIRDGDILATK